MDSSDDVDDLRPSPRISYDPETGPLPYTKPSGAMSDVDMDPTAHEIESHDPKLGASQNMFCCKVVTGILACVLALTLIIVAAVNGARNAAYSQSSAAHQHQVMLQAPPPDLSQKCTQENVLSERGFYECEERCEAADCCDYPTNLALSCLNDSTEDTCFEYHSHCSILSVDIGTMVIPKPPSSSLPEAPSDLSHLCSEESLGTINGFEGCVNECMKAECCWQKDGHVEPCPKEPVCGGYSECFAMDALDHKDDKISTEIAEKCADTNISGPGRNQCILACSNAACCFDPGLSKCPHQNADFCDQYQPCQKIYDASGAVIQEVTSSSSSNNNPTLPKAPLFLKFSCTQESLNTLPGFEECEGACLEAECCWKTNTCTDRAECKGYQECHNLLKDQDSIPNGSILEAPSYLVTACQSKSLETEAGHAMCEKACNAAKCCWSSKEAPATCQDQAACTMYTENCPNLEVHDNAGSAVSSTNEEHLNTAPDDLPLVCDAEKLATRPDDFFACQYACSLAECCWKAGNPNSCVGNPLCQGWATCTSLNGATSPPATTSTPASGTQQQSSTTSTSPPQTSSTQYTMEQIFDACLNHDNAVASSNHKSLCEIVCDPGSCCFDDSTTCSSDVQCHNYDPCHVLHPQDSMAVEQACGNTSDLSDCVRLCSKATCCYTNDIEKICEKTHPEIICEEFTACEIIYKSASQSQP